MQGKYNSFVTMANVLHPGVNVSGRDSVFPNAPEGWSREEAVRLAREENLELTEAHWQVVRALQGYYAKKNGDRINMRELHDALDEKFFAKGGIKYLYQILPAGPIAQGCRLAGLQAPAGAIDKGFGSVV
jgi:TusE/DsrC/DsvC family sulfur relay protein